MNSKPVVPNPVVPNPVVPQTFVRDVTDLMKVCLADGKFDSGEVLKVAALVSSKANEIEHLSDDDKKDLVLAAVQTSLKQLLSPEQFEQAESKFVLQVLPTVLDIALAASHGKDLKESVKAVQRKWFACLSCSSAKASSPVAPVEPSVMCASASNAPAGVEPAVVEAVPALAVREPEQAPQPLLSASL